MTDEQATLKRRGDALYDQYAKPLEEEHTGKYVAVSSTGQTLLGDTMLDVAKRAAVELGRGNFIFKLGSRSIGKWR